MQFLIDFKNDATDQQIEEYLALNGCTTINVFQGFERCYLVSCAGSPVVTDIVDVIVEDHSHPLNLLFYPITSGETFPQIEFSTTDQNDWWKMATFSRPNFEKPSQQYDRRGSNSVVYIVDSGVNVSHPEFEFADVSTLYTFNGDTKDYNGHGTAIASVISGKECGITSATIKSLKVFQSGVPTYQSHLLMAFDEIIKDVRSNEKKKFNIVNLSWSVPKNSYIESKIRTLINEGVFVIAAAGNSGTPIDDVTPASMIEVCTVGAYNSNLEPCNFSDYTGAISTTGDFVNHGELDIWAPGESIRVAVNETDYQLVSGTSIAAAIQSACMSYNSEPLILEDGFIHESLINNTWTFQYEVCRDGILVLNSPYENSVNKIATARGEYEGEDGMTYSGFSSATISGVSEEKIAVNMFPFYMFESYSLKDPLPEGFNFNNGWLVGEKQVDQPFMFKTTLTYRKLGGVDRDVTFTIIILPKDMHPEDPTLDPEIAYTLSLGCEPTLVYGYYSCDGTCIAPKFCADACGFSGTTKDPSLLFCYCAPPYQQCGG